MTGGGRIALLDCCDRRGDEALEQPLDRFVEEIVLDRHRGLPGQGAHQLDDLRVERDDFLRHGRGGQLLRRAGTFAVDELQHSDPLADVIGHRKDEHGAREIRVHLVE